MSSRTDPVPRLVNLRRKLADLLMGRRLSADPESSGVVDLANFGKRVETLLLFAAESATALEHAPGAHPAAVELELALRLAALYETLPHSPARVGRQCDVLEEARRGLDATIAAEGELRESPTKMSLAVLARQERDLYAGLRTFEGTIESSKSGVVDRSAVRRALRRAILDHAGGPFPLSVDRAGTLRFPEYEFRTEAAAKGLTRSGAEPPEVKRALDLYEASDDPELRTFLLVKAVDELVYAILSPKFGTSAMIEKARALPRRPGKRMAVRPEVVTFPIQGWQPSDAATGVEKLAARRIGTEWARLPKAAYLLRLFFEIDNDLAADLLALGPALRRLEKGEESMGSGARAEGALAGLLGLLG